MAIFKICALVTIVVFCVDCAPLDSFKTDSRYLKAMRILSQIPKEAQDDFLKYQILKGFLIEEKRENPKVNYDIDDSISTYIFEYVQKKNEITPDTRDVICWNNKCIDISDPGIHPA